MTDDVLDPESERYDRVWVGRGFKSWLVMQDPRKGGSPRDEVKPAVEFCLEYFGELPALFNYEVYANLMRSKLKPPRTGPKADEYGALIESLAKAEAEWRSEQIAKDRTKAVVMSIAHPHGANLSSRNPQSDDECGFRSRGGLRCKNAAVPGSPRCTKHGGALIDSEVRRAFLMTAYAAIVEATEEAVDVLVDVARNGRNELARVAAAKEILDRAGLNPALNINVNIGGSESDAMRQLRDKLDKIQKNLRESSKVIDARPDDVIDVVEVTSS